VVLRHKSGANPFSDYVPNRWTNPSTVVVVCILDVSYNIIGSAMVILAQIKVCLAATMGRWRQDRDIEAPRTLKNSSYVPLNDGWGPLKHWIGLHTTPHTCMPVQAGPTGSLSLGALRLLGLGWYGQYNSVQNIADHLKSLHTCPKWMDNAFYGGGCPYFGRLIQYYWLDNSNFGPN